MRKHHLKFIAKARKNMKRQNTKNEKQLLKNRFRIENLNQKLKSLVGKDFSRFRTWAAAKAVIGVAMAAINLGF
jgi:division protein CdvB (Snf7/Vps24/ESCRT-III family)